MHVFTGNDSNDTLCMPEEGVTYTIGRGLSNVVRIDRKALHVSEYHALLRCSDGKYQIKDLDSTNGTYIVQKQSKSKSRSRVRLKLHPAEWYTLRISDKVAIGGVSWLEKNTEIEGQQLFVVYNRYVFTYEKIDRFSCAICCGEEKHLVGTCALLRHRMCEQCFVDAAVTQLEECQTSQELLASKYPDFACPFHKSKECRPTHDGASTAIVSKLGRNVFAKLCDAKCERIASLATREGSLQEERLWKRKRSMAELDIRKDELSDEFIMRCPNSECCKPFDSYVGCAALKCEDDVRASSAGCGHHFCAFCFTDFGDDSVENASIRCHRHVKTCSHRPANMQLDFHCPLESFRKEFKKRATKRCEERIKELPKRLSVPLRAHLKELNA